MDIIDEENISPIEMISFITNLDAKKITAENYIDYLQFDLNKHRESMVETFAIESYSAQYIGNMIGRNTTGEEVIHSDDKRRTVRDIILERGRKPKGVFITSMSPNFPSAVALSIILNVGKIPVILGGIHVSVSPEDVDIFIRKYCPNPDLISLVIGAGDSKVIPEILQDLNSELLKSEYRGDRGIENAIWKKQSNVEYLEPMCLKALKNTPVIGRFLSKMKIIPVAPFLGCPYSCTFCSISAIPKNQRKFSIRSVDDFLDELEYYQKSNRFDSRFFFFLPDNLLVAKKNLIKILDGIIQRKLKVNFATQISIDVASDLNLLEKLRIAGATHFFIGLESLDVKNLEFIQKHILEDL